MNRRKFFAIVVFLLYGSSMAHAQLGKERYRIQSRSELRDLVLKNARNPRVLYDLTTWANRNGWLGTILKTSDEMLAKNSDEPYAQALFAFGVYTGLYARFWNWPVDQSAGDVWKRQSKASFFHRKSLRLSDPAIQLMAAISLANMPTNSHGEFKEALRLFRIVLKKQPKWADAHYWYGRALDRNGVVEGTAQRKKIAPQVLAQFDLAEKLDSKLKNFLLLDRFSVLIAVGKPREALAVFDKYLLLYPAFARYIEKSDPGYITRMRAYLNKQIELL